MKERLLKVCEAAVKSEARSERRPATYTKMARRICEEANSEFPERIWQCLVGTAGQLGFNIACSKDTILKTVIDGIEITLFYPKISK